MADKAITVVKAVRDEATTVALTSLATSDKVLVEWDVKDERTVMLFLGGSAQATVTIKAGNGVQGCNDLVVTVPASTYVAVPINSGGFKNTYGEDVGKVVLSTSAACSFAVVEGQ